MERVTLGLTEQVTIIGNNGEEEPVTARIDTGATASSIDSSMAKKLELKQIERFKIVKSASGTKRRPIVMIKIKMNGLVIEDEFTLADRSHMTYPLLIGQNILKKGNFLIDPNK
tara:strand:- start:1825 stop:2166 length:342 start_codon:yes stop_codon:yes gene_type:complete